MFVFLIVENYMRMLINKIKLQKLCLLLHILYYLTEEIIIIIQVSHVLTKQ